ncbi:hypothetical protein [Nonomuraea dietziae]
MIIPIILGIVGLAATAVLFVRTVMSIRASERAVMTRHLHTMQARGH